MKTFSRLIYVICAILLSTQCLAGGYTNAVISEDGTKLTISSTHGPIKAPRAKPDQEAFSKAHVSSDGRIVGWLVLAPSCCTSYPLPTSLVLFKAGKVVKVFDEAPPIWDWVFHSRNTVAYRQRTTHGASVVLYKLRRISDGKTLAEFDCDPNEQGEHSMETAPPWVWLIAEECPTQASTPAVTTH